MDLLKLYELPGGNYKIDSIRILWQQVFVESILNNIPGACQVLALGISCIISRPSIGERSKIAIRIIDFPPSSSSHISDKVEDDILCGGCPCAIPNDVGNYKGNNLG